jgi:hypothetical protein
MKSAARNGAKPSMLSRNLKKTVTEPNLLHARNKRGSILKKHTDLESGRLDLKYTWLVKLAEGRNRD